MNVQELPLKDILEKADSGVWAKDANADGISILRSTNFTSSGEVDFSNLAIKDVNASDRERKLFRPGDILLEKSGGGPQQPVGRVVFFRGDDRPHVFGNFIARLRTKSALCEARFLFWRLSHAHATGVTERFQKQTTGIRNLETKRFFDLPISLPPLEEQRRIVGLLDRAADITRRADAARAQARAIIPALFLETFGDPATNPKGWPKTRLANLIEGIAGGKNVEAGNGSSRYRILKVSAVTSGQFRPVESKPAPDDHRPLSEHHIRPGDFLFSRANTSDLVGAVAIVESTSDGLLLPDKIWRIAWSRNAIDPRFAYSLLRSDEIRRTFAKIASGTSGSMKNISQAKLRDVEIPLPPLPLQTAFAEQARQIETTAHALDAAAAKARAMAEALSAEIFGPSPGAPASDAA